MINLNSFSSIFAVAFRSVLLALFFIPVLHANASEDEEFRDKLILLGAGPEGGSFGPIGNVLCEAVNAVRRINLVRCVPIYSAGSVFNIFAVSNGSLQMGLGQEDLLAQVYNDVSDVRGGRLRTVSLMHNSPIGIMVRRSSGIKDLSQIRTGVINIGNKGAGYHANALSILRALNLQESDFKGVTFLQPVAFVKAFCEGNVDIIINALAHPSSQYKRLHECGGEFLDIPEAIGYRMMKDNPWLRPMVIPRGMYGSEQAEVKTLGVRNILFTNSGVDSQAVYRVTRVIMDQYKFLQSKESGLASMRLLELADTKSLAVPLHDGVLLYFNRRGP